MQKKLGLLVLVIVVSVSSLPLKGETIDASLYINRGYTSTYDSTTFSCLAFNSSPDFEVQNQIISLSLDDVLHLTVFNNDSIDHVFCLDGYVENETVFPGEEITVSIEFEEPGVYIYYDAHDYPRYRYMGLAGMIVVNDYTERQFYWNLKEHNAEWNQMIPTGYDADWTEYYPDVFTINGRSNPGINQDPVAKVTGNVGETIIINIANTGQSVHSMHFHGYHCDIIYSSKFPNHTGRSKDTFPVYSMETLVLRLIPDKPGEYPVHDHNLVAVSGANYYPNGMFLTIVIDE